MTDHECTYSPLIPSVNIKMNTCETKGCVHYGELTKINVKKAAIINCGRRRWYFNRKQPVHPITMKELCEQTDGEAYEVNE